MGGQPVHACGREVVPREPEVSGRDVVHAVSGSEGSRLVDGRLSAVVQLERFARGHPLYIGDRKVLPCPRVIGLVGRHLFEARNRLLGRARDRGAEGGRSRRRRIRHPRGDYSTGHDRDETDDRDPAEEGPATGPSLTRVANVVERDGRHSRILASRPRTLGGARRGTGTIARTACRWRRRRRSARCSGTR